MTHHVKYPSPHTGCRIQDGNAWTLGYFARRQSSQVAPTTPGSGAAAKRNIGTPFLQKCPVFQGGLICNGICFFHLFMRGTLDPAHKKRLGQKISLSEAKFKHFPDELCRCQANMVTTIIYVHGRRWGSSLPGLRTLDSKLNEKFQNPRITSPGRKVTQAKEERKKRQKKH